jgi:hypothetical protein
MKRKTKKEKTRKFQLEHLEQSLMVMSSYQAYVHDIGNVHTKRDESPNEVWCTSAALIR